MGRFHCVLDSCAEVWYQEYLPGYLEYQYPNEPAQRIYGGNLTYKTEPVKGSCPSRYEILFEWDSNINDSNPPQQAWHLMHYSLRGAVNDDFYESSRRANQSVLGQERTVIITPDTRVQDEQIIIEAPQELVIANTQSLLANHQLIYNRDIGQIVGSPEEDYFSPAPQRRKLKVIFRSKEKPPWRHSDGNYSKKVECSIPDVKPGLTWSKLKRGIPKFTWGKYRVTAYLDNGRQMTVYGVSYAEAEQQILALIKLSTAEIMNMTRGEDVTNIPNRRKLPILVYPVYAKLIEGDVTTSGQWKSNKRKTTRIDLWVDSEPEGLAENL